MNERFNGLRRNILVRSFVMGTLTGVLIWLGMWLYIENARGFRGNIFSLIPFMVFTSVVFGVCLGFVYLVAAWFTCVTHDKNILRITYGLAAINALTIFYGRPDGIHLVESAMIVLIFAAVGVVIGLIAFAVRRYLHRVTSSFYRQR